MITKTLGSSGADFTSITAWVSWVQANAVSGGNLTDSVTLDTLTVGVSPSASDTVSGWAPSGSNFTTTLTSSSGHSANSNASVQSNAFYYTTANGSFIDYTGGGSRGITISVDKATLSNQQIKTTGGNCIYSALSSGTMTISSNIIQGNASASQTIKMNSGVSVTLTNNLIVQAASGCYGVRFTNGTFADNTFVGVSGSYGISFSPGSETVTGNAFVGLTKETVGGGTVTGSNNATSNGAFSGSCPTTSGQTSLVVATEFQSTTDYRLKSGSAKLRNNGTAVGGVSFDWTGTTARPQGSEQDIGAWAWLVSAGVAPSRVMVWS